MDSRHNTDHKYNKRDDERRSRKLFIGGVSFSTTDEDFFKYFAKYGELEDCVLIREKDTGQSRGFGFVTYKDKAVSHHVAQQQLYLDGRRLDPKPSISKHRNQTTKVFVGGLHDDTAEAELSEHFCGFGEVLEVNIMYDRFTNSPRGFGFVTFKEPEVAHKVIHWEQEHLIHGKKVDCKPATARKDAFKREDHERSAPVYTNHANKASSREERWRKYHGDAEHGDATHPYPAHGHPHSAYGAPAHSSYAHGHTAYAQPPPPPHAYPVHSSYAHSSYAPPPPQHAYAHPSAYEAHSQSQPHSQPQPQPQSAAPAQAAHYAHYDPYYRHDARYAHYAPPTHSTQAQAPSGAEYKYPPQVPQPAHYPPATAPQPQTQAAVQGQGQLSQISQISQVQPPAAVPVAVGSGSGTHAAQQQRYDYYAQYLPPNAGSQVESGAKKEAKSVVLAAPTKPIQSGTHIQQTQPVPASYGPSRGSKATNSAQGARYSAY